MKILEQSQGKRCDEAEYLTYTHKRCSSCDGVKAVTEFYRKSTKTKRGWFWDSHCIACRNDQSREYAESNKERRNLRLQLWRKTNPKLAKKGDRRKMLRHKYDMSPNDYSAMLIAQDGKCYLCKRSVERQLCVDHDHKSGKVRHLLCTKCNSVLGWIENFDLLDAIREYVSDDPCHGDVILELANQ